MPPRSVRWSFRIWSLRGCPWYHCWSWTARLDCSGSWWSPGYGRWFFPEIQCGWCHPGWWWPPAGPPVQIPPPGYRWRKTWCPPLSRRWHRTASAPCRRSSRTRTHIPAGFGSKTGSEWLLPQNTLYIRDSRKTPPSMLLHFPGFLFHRIDETGSGRFSWSHLTVPLLQMESYSYLLSPHCFVCSYGSQPDRMLTVIVFTLFQFILLKDYLQKHYNR